MAQRLWAGEFCGLGSDGRTVPITSRYGCAGPMDLRQQQESGQYQRRHLPCCSHLTLLSLPIRKHFSTVNCFPGGGGGLSFVPRVHLIPIARSSTELGARGQNQTMRGRGKGREARSYDSDSNHPYLPCYANRHEDFRTHPPPPVPQPGIILVQKAKCTSCAQASWGGAQRGLAP